MISILLIKVPTLLLIDYPDLEYANPWSTVEDLSEFLNYCCPECDYTDKFEQSFSYHALQNHKNSTVFFASNKNKLSNDKHGGSDKVESNAGFFNEYEDNYKIGIKELENLVKNFFDEDGFPLSRNPKDLLFLSRYLIFCKKIIKDAQKYVPEFLENIIEKNITCLNFIKYPDGQLPLFNGSSINFIDQLDEHLKINIKNKNTKNILGGLFKLKQKRTFFIFVPSLRITSGGT